MNKKKKKKTYLKTESALVLTEEEITKIKTFIEEISQIPCIECVYILPLYSYLNRRAEAGIIALYSDDPKYNFKLTGVEEQRCDDGEIEEEFKADDIAYNYSLSSDRLSFDTVTSDFFKYPPTKIEELQAIIRLYYSKILFDRFGDKTKMYDEILSNFTVPEWMAESWDNVIPIENFDKLINNTLVLKKR